MSLGMDNSGESVLKNWARIPKILVGLVPLIIGSSPLWFGLTLLSRLLQAGIPGLQIYITALVINATAELFEKGTGLNHVLTLLAYQALLMLLGMILQSLDKLVAFRFQQKLKYSVDKKVVEKASKVPLSFFDQSASYDRLKRASFGQNGLEVVNTIIQAGQYVITIISYIVILYSFHWLLACALLSMVIPGIWINVRFGQMRFLQMRRQTPTMRREAYFMQLLTSKEPAKEVRLFGINDYFIKMWGDSYWKNAGEQFALEKRSFFASQLQNGYQAVLTISLLALLMWFGSLGRITIGSYVALAQAIQQSIGILQGLAFSISRIYQDALYAGELLAFLSEPEVEEPTELLSIPDKLAQGIEVNELIFTYPGTSRVVLDKVSFHIRPGEHIAIVGENGSGKSTLVKCLIGLYPEYEGAIAYDGISIREIGADRLRNRVSAVFQDFTCYQMTLKENIGLGKIEKMQDQDLIAAAAEKFGVDEILKTLPDEYESQLGATFANGRDLSYGQWQRIAISRAFFRDAEIIILDEPTAALDPMTEAALFERFTQLAEGKTSIMISHRLASCRHADRILVMKEGKLIECGSHEQLLSERGEYAKMFEVQSAGYN